jgi:Ran GTPase-activating protein (RanGAP) involved in mRNA processing and transport
MEKKIDSNWEKLEEAIQIHESSFSPENPKSRKYSAGFKRKNSSSVRSRSTCKESSGSRPQTSSLYRSFFSQNFEVLPYQVIQNIYFAKCQDLEIPVVPEQEKRFFAYCSAHFGRRRFELRENGLGPHSAKAIGEALRNNQHFAYVDLAKNFLRDEGALVLMRMLKKSTSIVHIDLSSNDITSEGSEQCISELQTHQSLISLNLSSHEGMHRNRIGLSGSRSLSNLLLHSEIIQFLNLAGTGLGSEGLETLMEGLESNRSLLSLNLSHNSINSKSLDRLVNILSHSQVQDLNLSNNQLGDDSCEPISLLLSGGLGKYPELLKLDMSENNITTSGLSKILAAVRINSQLSSLNLSRNDFSKGLSQNLLQFLNENVALKVMNFSYCSIKCESLLGISEGLSKNQGVRVLIFSNNFIADRGAEGIASGLSRNKRLEVLDLTSNRIKDRGGVALAKSLKMNNSLKTLILKNNSIKNEAGQVLVEVSRTKTNLSKINLDLNPVNLRYVHEINKNLKQNISLQQKMIVPKLQQALERVAFKESAFEDLQVKIANKQKEKLDFEAKLKNQGMRLEQASKVEADKLKELNEEYLALKEKSLKLTEEIDSLYAQIYVKVMQKLKLLIDKETHEFNDRIGMVAAEIRKLEKKSKK